MNGTQNPMPDSIDVLIEDDRWSDLGLLPLAERAFAAVFAERGLSGRGFEISILACDDKKIAELNAEFRGKPVATNVLSWPEFELAALEDGGDPSQPPFVESGVFDPSLGDVALSFDTCTREAAESNLAIEHHLTHLLVHSCLHLLGFDHETDADAARMQGIESKLLETMGIADPY